MSGTLYGAGVGPGDPELLTLKTLRLVREKEVLAFPGEEPKDTVAYSIVSQVCPEIAAKTLLAIPMPMTKDPVKLEEAHAEGAGRIQEQLDAGRDVVFLTLGDPTVYSTYIYVHERIAALGYETQIVSGITSFCAVASRLNIGLVENSEPLHVIPASYQIDDALKLPGTKVLMKAGKKMADVKRQLLASRDRVMMIENCGMPDEKIYEGAANIPEEAGYYSLIIIQESK